MNKFTLKVPDMMCMHCVGSITEELNKMEGLADVAVTLADKTVSFSAEAEKKNEVIANIEALGFDVQE